MSPSLRVAFASLAPPFEGWARARRMKSHCVIERLGNLD